MKDVFKFDVKSVEFGAEIKPDGLMGMIKRNGTISEDGSVFIVPKNIYRTFGLGDAVAAIAQPIARAIDAATGHRTNVAGCGGCKQRQAALNALVPDLGLSLKPRPENDKPPQR